MLEIIEADFNDAAHARAIIALLDEYARGPMGGGEPLSAHARASS
ncbi:GNAT family N-acetyltransferase, partial [Bordetella pertussis]